MTNSPYTRFDYSSTTTATGSPLVPQQHFLINHLRAECLDHDVNDVPLKDEG